MTWCNFCETKFIGDKALFNHWDSKLCPNREHIHTINEGFCEICKKTRNEIDNAPY